MPAKTLKNNHREEPRYHYSDIHLTWRKSLSDRWRSGKLHNLSQTGIAIVLPSATSIRAGQHIELMRKGSAKRLNCQIIRTELWHDDNILVACRLPRHNNHFTHLKQLRLHGKVDSWLARRPKHGKGSKQTILVHP